MKLTIQISKPLYNRLLNYGVVMVGDQDKMTLGDAIRKGIVEPEGIEPEEITGTLGRLLDEVDMPADIQQEVEDLYQRAIKEVR